MATSKRKTGTRKTTTGTKKRATPSRRRRSGGGAKFAGRVRVSGAGGEPGGREAAVGTGAHLVVSLDEVTLWRLPERGRRSEVQLDVACRTGDRDGGSVGSGWSSGVLYYVKAGLPLNLQDVVIFDGPVHQHLSLDLSIYELELPQIKPDDAAALAAAVAEAAGAVVGPAARATAALEAFPTMLGSILRLNGDDQVLKLSVSLFTREVPKPDGAAFLAEGRYRIDKLPDDGQGDPAVSLMLDVRAVV